MLDYIYTQHHHRLQSWNQHFLQPAILKAYANLIHEKGAPLENCRPKPIYQRIVYSGHKKGPFYKVSKFGSAKRPD